MSDLRMTVAAAALISIGTDIVPAAARQVSWRDASGKDFPLAGENLSSRQTAAGRIAAWRQHANCARPENRRACVGGQDR
jgi:hypothetical protein